jgi:hypothetical protein
MDNGGRGHHTLLILIFVTIVVSKPVLRIISVTAFIKESQIWQVKYAQSPKILVDRKTLKNFITVGILSIF